MLHDIRLVIWDLDETFWDGTLCEGGITYNAERHDIVVALSHRGILNSLCSRNDLAAVEPILRQHGIWDYFIFPSVNWSSKPERLAEIVAAVQLRPETVLFVDDNPGNRAQAKALLPALNVVDETAIAGFLQDPAFAGRPDPGLSRLRQYKLLESRHQDMRAVGGQGVEFLRQSRIEVSILYDIENHLDRAVELVNRTNQLNFTKRRLPEDMALAKAALLEEIAPFHARAGLVQVRDRYGDYGICGIFLVHGITAWGRPRLVHFAFSCRTLGMGVEQWVYDLLGRPDITVVGEPLSELPGAVDWITAGPGPQAAAAADKSFGEVRIRGGCELEVIEHFFRARARAVVGEFIAMREHLYIPRHASLILGQIAAGLDEATAGLIRDLGMDRDFYETRLFDACDDETLIIYSPSGDASRLPYRHKATGFECHHWFREPMLPGHPGRTAAQAAEYERVTALLERDYTPVACDDPERYFALYSRILASIPANALFVVILPNKTINLDGVALDHAPQVTLNAVFRAAAKPYPNVAFVELSALVGSVDDVESGSYLHFSRAVYFRLFEEIGARYRDWLASRRSGSAPGSAAGSAAPAPPP